MVDNKSEMVVCYSSDFQAGPPKTITLSRVITY